MKIELRQHGSVSVVVPRGAITAAEIEDLQRVLTPEIKKPASRVVLDMAHVPYLDGVGIEYLLSVAGTAASAPLRPRIAALSDTVRETLDLTDTLRRFYRFDTVENAVRSYM